MLRDLGRRTAAAVVIGAAIAGSPAAAQEQASAPPKGGVSLGKFLAGAGIGFVFHEVGHLGSELAVNAHPRLERVQLLGLPFFAITPRSDLSPRRKLIAATAGFWMQDLMSERLLSTHPDLRFEAGSFTKGEFAFDELTTIGYGLLAMANVSRPGEPNMDTRAMSDATGIRQPVIGAVVIAPVLLDAYRYYHPTTHWAKWASRATKAASLFLLVQRT